MPKESEARKNGIRMAKRRAEPVFISQQYQGQHYGQLFSLIGAPEGDETEDPAAIREEQNAGQAKRRAQQIEDVHWFPVRIESGSAEGEEGGPGERDPLVNREVAQQQEKQQGIDQVDRQNRRHVRRKVEAECPPHQGEIDMADGTKIGCIESGLEERDSVIPERRRRRPAKIIKLIVLKISVVRAIVEREEGDHDHETRGEAFSVGGFDVKSLLATMKFHESGLSPQRRSRFRYLPGLCAEGSAMKPMRSLFDYGQRHRVELEAAAPRRGKH